MAPNTTDGDSQAVQEIYFDAKKLPSFSKLNARIREIEDTSTWMERYGWDWLHIIGIAAMVPGALKMVGHGSPFDQVIGTLILGFYHCIFANKSGHIAAHNALCQSKTMNAIWTRFFVEFVGSYSYNMAIDNHVKMHHPHTNIIGLGDSSVWKVPHLSRVPYMLITPLAVPLITPLVAIGELIQRNMKMELLKFCIVAGSGLALHITVLMQACNFTFVGAFCFLFTFRAVTGIPYIHINIFQHIGLPMYSNEHRPARIYQMASGVLNLRSNFILDRLMGHSLISCHVQHHLFPRLSDNMCKKVEDVVREYLTVNGLPYNEDSYWNRFKLFMKDYDTLMVKAPPITHFVGIQ